MNYLTHYTKKGTDKIFAKYGVFFAFSNEQFYEKRDPEVKYKSCGQGMICPAEHVKTVFSELDKVIDEAIKEDVSENTIEGVILRELNNYECFYVGDIEDAIAPLASYGVTVEQIRKVYNAKKEAYWNSQV